MLNLKSLFITASLLIAVHSASAQKIDFQEKVKAIEASGDPTLYLVSFLKEASENPKKYQNADKQVRDSVSTQLLMDYQALLFTVFKDSKHKNTQEIKNYTNKAFGASMQMVNEGVFSAARQSQLDKYITQANSLLPKR